MNGKRLEQIVRCLVLLVVFAGAIAGCGSESQERVTAQAEKEQAQQMGEALAAVCEGQAVSETAAYSQVPGIHPVIVLRGQEGSSWRVDASYSLAEWQPQGLQNVELVACLQNNATLIETCPYTLENSQSVSVERYQYLTHVTLREAKTGQIIAKTDWSGSEPEKCSAQTTFKEGEPVKKVYGVAVGGREVESWLQPYVVRP